MGFFDFLFSKPGYLEHAFFGRLQWVGGNWPDKGGFEGTRLFQPTGHLLELSIYAPATGPTAAHVAFFQWVEAQHPALCQAAAPLITAELSCWIPGFQIRDFAREFTPTYLTIPANPADPLAKWEVHFDTTHTISHYVSVSFVGATPTLVLFTDG